MISLENITKKYRDDIVLNQLNLCLNEEKITVLLGVSGCGKTSLMKIVAGIDSDYDGKFFLNNKCLSGMTDRERSYIRAQSIGYIPQDIYLMEKNTVKDNILLSLLYYPNKKKINELSSELENLLEKLGLLEKIDKKVELLSTGEKRRVMIARALIKNPDIIIADEPTSGLDKNSRINIFELFEKFKAQKTLVFIATHDEFAVNRCDRILRMRYGVINEELNNTAY